MLSFMNGIGLVIEDGFGFSSLRQYIQGGHQPPGKRRGHLLFIVNRDGNLDIEIISQNFR